MIEPNPARHLRRLAVQPGDYLTAPISLGLRIGEPSIAAPDTEYVPFWQPKPDVPQPVRYTKPRRSLRMFIADELPGALVVLGTVGATATVIAAYVTGAF